jgi:hypothetical protein
MELQMFSDHGEAAACMDGSGLGFYFAPATTQPDQYIVYLQGGGWCYDQASCEGRCNRKAGVCTGGLATSTVWETTQNMTGLFSAAVSRIPDLEPWDYPWDWPFQGYSGLVDPDPWDANPRAY